MVPNLKSKDYYEILGCPKTADEAALKKAYRKLAVKVSFWWSFFWWFFVLFLYYMKAVCCFV
jgi:lipopolysaccharide export LptBFGC system permease protein LptF